MTRNEPVKGQRYTVKLHAGGGVVDAEFRGRFGTEYVFDGPDGRMRSYSVMSVQELVPELVL